MGSPILAPFRTTSAASHRLPLKENLMSHTPDTTTDTADRTPQEWPLWEVFVRPKAGLDHKHCGSLHAPDAPMALQLAREVYTRRQEGCSIWVVPSSQITASDPGDKDMYFDPMEDKVYRHPTFYVLPEAVDHM
jgi:ring-1,2-phenylacetyl-CoA epoxidase subunit PaaB